MFHLGGTTSKPRFAAVFGDCLAFAYAGACARYLGITPIWFEAGHFECVKGLLRLARNEMRYRNRV
jgi:hypothetical protein